MAQFMDTPLPRKLLRTYNLRTTNAIRIKLGTIVYRHKTLYLAKDLGVIHREWQGVAENPLKKAKKSIFWGPFLGIFNNILKSVTYVILCLALHHWWKFCTNWTWFGLVIYQKPPKSSQKSYFLLVRQTLKIYNLTTTNAIPLKLTRIVYLHEAFHLPKYWGANHTAKESVVQKFLKINHKMRFLG